MPHTVVSDYLVTNPVEAATTYRALTQTAANWATYESGYGLITCQQGSAFSPLPATINQLLVLRFLWHGLPVAVVTHYPIRDNPYQFWTCQNNLTEWQVSAGGIANPRPYLNDAAVYLFPTMPLDAR